jgi:hypothetical protein
MHLEEFDGPDMNDWAGVKIDCTNIKTGFYSVPFSFNDYGSKWSWNDVSLDVGIPVPIVPGLEITVSTKFNLDLASSYVASFYVDTTKCEN